MSGGVVLSEPSPVSGLFYGIFYRHIALNYPCLDGEQQS
jgi:hypothetical protein